MKAEVLAVCWSRAFRYVLTTKKDISSDHRETTIAAHQSGKGYKVISKQFGLHHSKVKKIIHKNKQSNKISDSPGID